MMKRGDIFFADLDPTLGGEIKKRRPVLVVSNDANNRASTTVTVIPLTSNVTKIYPFEVLLPVKESGLAKPSKAQCQQVRTISKLRFTGKRVGVIHHRTMEKIENALRLHLDLLD